MIPIRLVCSYPSWNNIGFFQILSNIFTGYDVGMLWFLPTLFFITILATLCNKIKNTRIKYIYYLFIFIISLKPSIFPSIFYISSVASYWFWFEFGNYIHKNIDSFVIKKQTTIFLMLLLLLSISLLFYIDYKLMLKCLEILIPIIMFLTLYSLYENKKVRVVNEISCNSFGLYLFHSPLLYFLVKYFSNISIPVFVFIGFFILGITSYIFTKTIKKTKFKIVIGE